jgi:hypothetical protein
MDLAGHATSRIHVICYRCATAYDCDYGYIGRRLRCRCGIEVPILATKAISTQTVTGTPALIKTSQRNVRIGARFRPIPVAALTIVLIATSLLFIHFEGRAIATIAIATIRISEPLTGALHKEALASRAAPDSAASAPQVQSAKYEVVDAEPSRKKLHARLASPCTQTDAQTRSGANGVCP